MRGELTLLKVIPKMLPNSEVRLLVDSLRDSRGEFVITVVAAVRFNFTPKIFAYKEGLDEEENS
jgi:hypothetical protein